MRSSIRIGTHLSSMILAVFFSLAVAHSARAAPVRLFLQAPVDFNNPEATRLDSIEEYGTYPVFDRDFKIPYDDLQAQINSELKALVPATYGGTVVCTDPCPDVDWSIRISPKFTFTQQNQPVITSIGSSDKARVKVELTTQARLDIHADVHAETWFDSIDTPVDIFMVVGLKAGVEIQLWPTISANKPGSTEAGIALEFSLVDKNIDIDLNGTAAALGAKWGTIVGLSPAGLLVGGPILGPLLAILGDEAANLAEGEISKVFHSRVEAMFNKETSALESMVNTYFNPYVQQADQVRERLMSTKLPHVNKGLTELSNLMGATVQLHTATPNQGLSVSAVLRSSGTAGNGGVSGRIRVPRQRCEYVAIKGGPLAGATIPLRLVETNTDLKAAVGKPCSLAMPGSFGRRVYLGGNPQTVLGPAAQNLPSWKDGAGQLVLKGQMSQTDKWYECGFEVNTLPTAAILELDSQSWFEQHGVKFKERYLGLTLGGQRMAFGNFLGPLPNNEIILGGEGECQGGGGGHGLAPDKLKELEDTLNPEKCPQCGVLRKPGVIEVNNGAAFAETSAGRQLLQTVRRRGRQTMPGHGMTLPSGTGRGAPTIIH